MHFIRGLVFLVFFFAACLLLIRDAEAVSLENLAKDKEWLSLLHYRSSVFNKSNIKNSSFFFHR